MASPVELASRAVGSRAVHDALTAAEREGLRYCWPAWARPCEARPVPSWLSKAPGHGVWRGQLAPPGVWTTWLYLAGRASGKTRAGAEWVRATAEANPGCRIAIVGATSADARKTMVKGKSGVLAVCPPWASPRWYHTDQIIQWSNGSQATLYTADEPGRLRGPEHDFAWADELCAWSYPEAWQMLLMTMRGGSHPRTLVTTTPNRSAIIRELMSHANTALTVGATRENAANLPVAYLSSILTEFEGTHLGRQELEGEVVQSVEGALWQPEVIETTRVSAAPELVRVVVALDPSGSVKNRAALAGIVVAGIAESGHAYVIEDLSDVMGPDAWARVAVGAFERHSADRLLAEVNHGGEMVRSVLQTVAPDLPVTLVNASRGKYVRAEPVAALYEQGRVHHVGGLAHLEDQMCGWTPESRVSPDRMDALVYALTELMLGGSGGCGFL